MDGNAKAEPCTRKLAWFHSATSMDGLAQVHGWTFLSAWFSFRRSMDGHKTVIPEANDTSNTPPFRGGPHTIPPSS